MLIFASLVSAHKIIWVTESLIKDPKESDRALSNLSMSPGY